MHRLTSSSSACAKNSRSCADNSCCESELDPAFAPLLTGVSWELGPLARGTAPSEQAPPTMTAQAAPTRARPARVLIIVLASSPVVVLTNRDEGGYSGPPNRVTSPRPGSSRRRQQFPTQRLELPASCSNSAIM